MIAVVRAARGLQPAVWINQGKIDRVARLLGQLFKILELGAAVAFAERVNIVHVAHDRPGRTREGVAAQASQEVRLLKPPVNVGHAGFDVLAKLELVAALGDLDGAQLARPRVDILEKMPVNGAKVGQVETARGCAFGDPLGDKLSLNVVEPVRVGYAAQISKGGRARI